MCSPRALYPSFPLFPAPNPPPFPAASSRPAVDSGRAADDYAAKSRLGKAARSDSWGFAADLVGFWGIPDPVFVSQGLVHEVVVLIWRRGFSPAWPPSGRLRPGQPCLKSKASRGTTVCSSLCCVASMLRSAHQQRGLDWRRSGRGRRTHSRSSARLGDWRSVAGVLT